jgi:tyrosine-protein kinase Etk/Wzc
MKQTSLYPKVRNAADNDVNFLALLGVLMANRWLILGITSAFIGLGGLYAFLVPATYETNVLLQVEDRPDTSNSKNVLGDASSMFDVKSSTAAEAQILGSRAIIERTVDKLLLFVDAKPRRFPIIGSRIAENADGLSTPGIFGLGGFAWGTESITVKRFDVPAKYEGHKFVLLYLGNGRYQLSGADLEQAVSGQVGQKERFSTPKGPIDLTVADLSAKQGVVFDLYRNSRLRTIEGLQNNLDVQEKVKQSGVVVATLQGEDPQKISDILEEIEFQYTRQDMERKAVEAAKSLDFLKVQLPALKRQLEEAQQKNTDLLKDRAIVDLPEEAKLAINQMGTLKAQMLALQQNRRELATRFTADYPAIEAIDNQIRAFQVQQNRFSEQLSKYPDLQQDVARSALDVKIDTALYTALLSNAQQLELVKAGKTGTIRLIDTPVVPDRPIHPKKSIILILSAFAGLLTGAAVSLLRSMIRGVSHPSQIERRLGLDVYATIPFSERQRSMVKSVRKLSQETTSLLAEASRADPAVESLRTLRTVLHHGMEGAANKIILVTGATPGVGKSFIAANLATVLATTGKSVLLIDADLRNGHLHQYFGRSPGRGLSEFLSETVDLSDIVREGVVRNLDFVSTGTSSFLPDELLLSSRLESLLEDCANSHDIVVIDSPPILAVSDASTLAKYAGTVFLVALSEVTKIAELDECSRRLERAGARITGVIFNGANPKAEIYGYGAHYGRQVS